MTLMKINSRGGLHKVMVLALAFCATAVTVTKGEHGEDPELPLRRVPRERMAAWDKTLVLTDEHVPNSALLGYMRNAYVDHNLLVKLVPGVESDGAVVWASAARDVAVEDFPGGVTARFRLGNTQVRTEFVPFMIGRGLEHGEGLAQLKVTTDPPTPVVFKVGSGKSLVLVHGPVAYLRTNDVQPFEGGVRLEDNLALCKGGKEGFPIALRSSGEISIEEQNEQGQTLSIRMDNGSGRVLLAYSNESKRAAELTEMDPDPLRAELDAYYEALFRTRIETPEPIIDKALRAALYNLEYNWVEPYGWVECCHHWMWLFHMQVTAGAEWIGQTDRSRQCTLTHAENLLPSGAVPQLSPYKQIHRSFGGSNQYWGWQVRHYWQFTGELDFAGTAAPALDRVLEQTFEENDADNNLLLAWGKQIGNQEDFIATPYDGATSSIEGINMMRTRAELARGLNDDATAALWDSRADRATSLLREKLWLPDLGRFAFFVDSHGNQRLDAQYHTFIYPLIWDIVDTFDGYTTLRHVRDRLTDPDGEVYCSNNFPNHIVGTWGMQGGAAQQPWAAWGLAAAGLHNETYRPLKAMSEWVFDINHRGAWPEVSKESAPAYFTPPAGLFLAAVTEALFGLRMNAPDGEIEIAPSFPDHWPTAKLDFPEFKVEYRRDGPRLTYVLETKQPLARKMRWKLPPAHIEAAYVDGKKVPFSVEPGVGYVVLCLDTAAARKTEFTVVSRALPYEVNCPASIAEGERLELELEGLEIVSIDDRHGVFSSTKHTGRSRLEAQVCRGLLAPYLKFGRLGQLNFSRRTFFVECRALTTSTAIEDAVRFWLPVDLTVLPRYEVAPAQEVALSGEGIEVRLLVRNNTESALQGTAWLHAVRSDFACAVDVPPRSEKEVTVVAPRNLAPLFSIGDNVAHLTLPSGEHFRLTLTAGQLFAGETPLAVYAQARLVDLPLSDDQRIPDAEWPKLRKNRFYPGVPWPGWKHPMDGLADRTELAVPEYPGVRFTFPQRRFVPLSTKIDKPVLKLELGSVPYKKLYLLLYSFLDNHDMFAEVGHISVSGPRDVIHARTLRFPGDVDWWDNSWPHNARANSTARQPRPNRFGLLPLLTRKLADWEEEGRAPHFPQPEFWATSLVVRTPTSNLNVIEIDLGRLTPVESLTIEPVGADPAFGLVALVGERSGGVQTLADTEWMPPARFRDPRELVVFSEEGDPQGWRLEGEAFSVAPVPRLFDAPTLNSLARSGEAATGRAVSPPFTLWDGENQQLEIEFHGGNSVSVDGKENLCLRVVDAESGEVLRELVASGSHVVSKGSVSLEGLEGKTLRLELIDRNTETGFAWIGLRSARISSR